MKVYNVFIISSNLNDFKTQTEVPQVEGSICSSYLLRLRTQPTCHKVLPP